MIPQVRYRSESVTRSLVWAWSISYSDTSGPVPDLDGYTSGLTHVKFRPVRVMLEQTRDGEYGPLVTVVVIAGPTVNRNGTTKRGSKAAARYSDNGTAAGRYGLGGGAPLADLPDWAAELVGREPYAEVTVQHPQPPAAHPHAAP